MPEHSSQKSSAPAATQSDRPGARIAEKADTNRNGISRLQPQIGNRAMGRLLAALRVQPQGAPVGYPLERETDRAADAELAKPARPAPSQDEAAASAKASGRETGR